MALKLKISGLRFNYGITDMIQATLRFHLFFAPRRLGVWRINADVH
ncbi:hypothetical protein Barb4_00037 [Bacteroidales bacterium Barb4]|nr:hypothetical protein Barb4_00037 [Bacteroidales bacterium Barb4]